MQRQPQDESWLLQLLMASGIVAIGIGVLLLVLSIVPFGELGFVVAEFIVSPEVALVVLCGIEAILWITRRYRTELIPEQGFYLATHVIQILGYLSVWQYLSNEQSFSLFESLGLSKLYVAVLAFLFFFILNLAHLNHMKHYWHDVVLVIFSYLTAALLADPAILQDQAVVIIIVWAVVTLGNLLSWRWMTRFWVACGQIFLSSVLLHSSALTAHVAYLLPFTMLHGLMLLLHGMQQVKVGDILVNRGLFRTDREYLVTVAFLGVTGIPLVQGGTQRLLPLVESLILIAFLVVFLLILILRSPTFSSAIGVTGFIITFSIPFMISTVTDSQYLLVEASFSSIGLFLALLLHAWRFRNRKGGMITKNMVDWRFIGWLFLYLEMHLHVRFEFPILSMLFIFGGLLLLHVIFISDNAFPGALSNYLFPSIAWLIQMATFPPSVEALLMHHSMFIAFLALLMIHGTFITFIHFRSKSQKEEVTKAIAKWETSNVIILGLALLLFLLFVPSTWLYPLVSSILALVILFAGRVLRKEFSVRGIGHLGMVIFFFTSSLAMSLAGSNLEDSIKTLGLALGIGLVSTDYIMNKRRELFLQQPSSELQDRSTSPAVRLSLSDVHMMGLFLSLMVFFSINVVWINYLLVFIGLPLIWLGGRMISRSTFSVGEVRMFSVLLMFLFPLFHYFLQVNGKVGEILPETILGVMLTSWFLMLLASITINAGGIGILRKIQGNHGIFVTSSYLLIVFILSLLETLTPEITLILVFVFGLGGIMTGLLSTKTVERALECFLLHLSFVLAIGGFLTLVANPNHVFVFVIVLYVTLLLFGTLVVLEVFGNIISLIESSSIRFNQLSAPIAYLVASVMLLPVLSIGFRVDLMVSTVSYVIVSIITTTFLVIAGLFKTHFPALFSRRLALQLSVLMQSGGALIILLGLQLNVAKSSFFLEWDKVSQLFLVTTVFIVAVILVFDLIKNPSRMSNILVFFITSILMDLSLSMALSDAWNITTNEEAFLVLMFIVPFILLGGLTILSLFVRFLHEQAGFIDGLTAGLVLVLLVGLLFHVNESIFALMSAVALVFVYLIVQARWQRFRIIVASSSVLFVHLGTVGIVLALNVWNSIINNVFPFELAAALLIWGFVTLIVGNNLGRFYAAWRKTLPPQEVPTVIQHQVQSTMDEKPQMEEPERELERRTMVAEESIKKTPSIGFQCPNCQRMLKKKGRFCIYCGYFIEMQSE